MFTSNRNLTKFFTSTDPEVLAAIEPWKKDIDERGKRIVGVTKVPLQKEPCSKRECNLGNFVADAFVHYYITEVSGKNQGALTDSVVGLVPTGAIRTTLNTGREFFSIEFKYLLVDLDNFMESFIFSNFI